MIGGVSDGCSVRSTLKGMPNSRMASLSPSAFVTIGLDVGGVL